MNYVNEKCYVHNIFTTNFKWWVVNGLVLVSEKVILIVGSNKNKNNLQHKIFYKNVVNITLLYVNRSKPYLVAI